MNVKRFGDVIHDAQFQPLQLIDPVPFFRQKDDWDILGAPVGAMLCGSTPFIKSAHRLRKQLGGGMRQAGVLAACGLYALEHNITRLADDHDLARQLAEGISSIAELPVRYHTNMVFIEPETHDLEPLRLALIYEGVLMYGGNLL